MIDSKTRECPAVTEAIIREAFEDMPTQKQIVPRIDDLPMPEIIWDDDDFEEKTPAAVVLSSLSDRVNLVQIRA